jgi:predicted TPR repeat methyltransferase
MSAELSQEKKAALHDAYAAEYDDQVRQYDCYLAEALFGLCYEFTEPGQKLLDVGIGSGLSAQLFTKAGLCVYGMDFSPAMLEVCRLKGIALELKQGDVQKKPWPYPTQAFDIVVCCGVTHFIPDLETLFSEAERVLQRGGYFAFTTKSPGLPDVQGKYEKVTSGELEVFSHSPKYLEDLLELNGFERRKVLRCYVGQDLFYLWTVQKK